MIAVILAALLACTPVSEPHMCTEIAVSSVMLDVVGPDGAPLAAEVTATNAAGTPVDVMCAEPDSGSDCTRFVVGYEVSGPIHIHAQAFDGCNTGQGDVDVTIAMDEAGCHVVTRSVTLAVDEWTDLACDTAC